MIYIAIIASTLLLTLAVFHHLRLASVRATPAQTIKDLQELVQYEIRKRNDELLRDIHLFEVRLARKLRTEHYIQEVTDEAGSLFYALKLAWRYGIPPQHFRLLFAITRIERRAYLAELRRYHDVL